jgi:hypothetical protein
MRFRGSPYRHATRGGVLEFGERVVLRTYPTYIKKILHNKLSTRLPLRYHDVRYSILFLCLPPCDFY